jgi:hypothetical protein
MRTGTFGQTLTGDRSVDGTASMGGLLQTNALPWVKAGQSSYDLNWRLEGNRDAQAAAELLLEVTGINGSPPPQGTTGLSVELEAPRAALSDLGKPSPSLTEQLWIRLVSAPGADPSLVSISKIFANGTLRTLAPGSAAIQTAGGVGSPYFLLLNLDFRQRW